MLFRSRELVIAALISPGHADNSISIALGYGRKKTGPVGEEAGFNAYLLRTSSNPHYLAVDGKTIGNGSPGPLAMRLRRLYIEGARAGAV